MSLISKKNNAVSKVATVGGIDASTNPVTFNVTTGEGTKFPTGNFKISIDNEILLCTTRTGDALTCSRQQEQTSMAAHSQNATVEVRITAGVLEEYDAVFKGTSTASEAEKILLDDLSADPATPTAGHRELFFKNGQAYQMGSDGVVSTVGGGASYWTSMPAAVTRVSDTQFTIPDSSNTNKYDKLFGKGCLLRWDEGGTTQIAMVKSSSYNTNVVTVNIVGNSLTAGFTAMKYCLNQAIKNAGETPLVIAPMPSAGLTDVSKTIYLPEEMFIISYDLRLKAAGSGTGSTIVDLNANGTSLATTKATITGTNTSSLDNVCDAVSANTLTATAKDSAITVDVDSLTSTVPTSDGYVDFYGMPVSWLYR